MSDLVRLVFSGEVLEGFETEAVKREVGQRLKLEGAQLDRLFRGKKVVVRREIERAKAERMVERFLRHGARFHIEAMRPQAPSASAAETGDHPVESGAPDEAEVTHKETPPPEDPDNPRTQVLEEVMCEACGEVQFMADRCQLCGTPLGKQRKKAATEASPGSPPSTGAPASEGPASTLLPPTPEMLAEIERSRQAPAAQPDWNQFESPTLFSLSFRGRMGRVYFAIGTLVGVGALAWMGMGLLLFPYMMVLYAVTGGAALVGLWFLRLLALRFHDLGFRGWWSGLLLLPWVNLVLMPLLTLWPGNKVFNRFGHPPMASNSLIGIAAVLLLAFDTFTIGSVALEPIHRQEIHLDRWPPITLRDFVADHAAPQAPQLPSDAELLEKLQSAAAVKAFKEGYWLAKADRAFAWSPDGAFAWAGGGDGETVVSERALAECRKLRRPYTQDCRVVHLNSIWTYRAAR